MTFILIPYIFLGIFILVAFYTDITTMQIPNWLNMCGAGGGLIYNFASNGLHGFYASIFGFAVGLGVLLLMYTFKAIGAGDVKLFAAIGAISGTEFVLYAIMYAIVFGGVIGLIYLIIRKQFFSKILFIIRYFLLAITFRDRDSLQTIYQEEHVRFPFMVAVVPAVITTSYYFVV